VSEIRTHEQVVGIIRILAQEANDDGVNEREELGPQTKQAIEWLSATDAALRAENERLRAAAREAHAALTRLADSAAYWANYDVPVGIVAEVDEAKARLAGALSREARP
jgi:hypothetical protein